MGAPGEHKPDVMESEYLRGYRDALAMMLGKIGADPLSPTRGSAAEAAYREAVDAEARETLGVEQNELMATQEELVEARKEIGKLERLARKVVRRKPR